MIEKIKGSNPNCIIYYFNFPFSSHPPQLVCAYNLLSAGFTAARRKLHKNHQPLGLSLGEKAERERGGVLRDEKCEKSNSSGEKTDVSQLPMDTCRIREAT
jgi:hypothetical protein